MLARIAVAAGFAALLSSSAGAQPATFSMGQPLRWQPYAAALAHRHSPGGWDPRLALGAHRALGNPVTGLLGVTGEVILRNHPGFRTGARLMATSRAVGLSAGMDWDGQSRYEPVLSWQTAVRRGGLLGGGTMLRVDWLPRGEDELAVGVHVPVWQRRAGRTRPRETTVELQPAPAGWEIAQGALPLGAERAMGEVARAASTILAYSSLFSEDTAHVRYGRSFDQAMNDYTRSLVSAFTHAVGEAEAGAALAARARRGLLEGVILPYDSLFGQVKENEGTIRPLTAAAHARFAGWVRDTAALAGDGAERASHVHARLMGIVEGLHASLSRQWKDSRLVWLPLQLALTAQEYDEQSEVDALVERAVGRPFTDRNALTYLRSSDLPLEIARTIFAARRYHVLWTHDFTGQRDENRELDEMAYTMVADVYLPALTAAVQRHDSVGRLPVYMVFIDEFFYARRNGRLWMNILSNPLQASMKLPGSNAEREAHLLERQRELRAAVAASRTLPAGAARVHVNVLNPADFSFRSHRILPPLPFVPDNIMRDHRKLVFYDLDEANPYDGALIIMGVGIGEHYATATWEDRGHRVRGPAALEARRGLRRVWRQQGMDEAQLPAPLRDPTGPGTPPDSVVTFDYVGRALQVHNETGFGPKHSSVARAMLYNLAPAGSVIIVPDPIWVSETWAEMLAGAAARGARVYVISPAAANNPNPQAPIQAAQRDVMLRLIEIRSRLAKQLAAAGGELRVGLYASTADVTDIPGRIAEVREGLRRSPWISEVIPFDAATLATLERAVIRTEDGRDANRIADDARPRAPKLHQKTQLIARPGAIGQLVRQPGWDEVLMRAMQVQSGQSARFADQLGWVTPDVDSAAVRSVDGRMRGYEQSLSETDRKAFSFYFSVGMQNMDPRGIMLDGEATLIVSGLQAAVGLADLYYLMARSTWIESPSQLDALVPPPGWLTRIITRIIRNAL